jgi:hypothetical protein
MTASYAAMFGFGIVLLGSWAGWGAAIQKLVLRRVVADRGMQAGWGLALTLLVGGLLNLTGRIAPRSILLFVTAGFALLLWDGYRDRHRLRAMFCLLIARLRREWLLAAAVMALSGALAVVYAASICSTRFNDHDDLQAYFVFPAKMTQTGALGSDPYSERRIVSLGSMSFLHAIVLSVADPKYFRIVDPGISLLLSVALLAGIARVARANRWAAMLAVFLFLLIPPPAANVTSSLTGLSLFLTLFLTLYRTSFRIPNGERMAFLGAVPVALTASALCSLKTTHVLAAALVIAAAYSIRGCSRRNWSTVIGEAALVAGLTLLFLAPWMVSLYQSNGTPLYPLLGRGFHGSAYGTYWAPGVSLTLSSAIALLQPALLDLKATPLIILGVGALLRSDLGARRWVLVGWAVAATVSLLSIPLALGGALETYRYSYAFLNAAIFTLIMFAFPSSSGWRPRRRQWRRVWPVGVLAVGVLLIAHSHTVGTYCSSLLTAISQGVRDSQNPHFMLRVVRRYAKMQQAIPEGATVLTRVQYPFLLDFTRNQIFIADYPGGSSPPPGIPFFRGGDRLADYLCRRPIRYVAYSYRLEAGFYDDLFRERLSPGTEPWLRLQALHTQDFQRNLAELGRTRKSVYDDGDVFVLDLSTSSNGQPLSCTPW